MDPRPQPSSSASGRRVITLNGGSSSVKFAAFEVAGGNPQPIRVLSGSLRRIGLPDAVLTLDGQTTPVAAPDHGAAAALVLDGLTERPAAVGHRLVHGGPRLFAPQRITPEVLDELRRVADWAPEHLPGEIALIDAFSRRHPDVPQVAVFDTAFHAELPCAARTLPVPRRLQADGIRRYGFHGISYAYLMGELERVAGAAAAGGKVILAHLGNGASMAAVRDGRCVDTTMGFTPAGGLVMGTRPGDLDPGLIVHLARSGGMTPDQLYEMINRRCGLAGVSETSSDMRDLLAREQSGDARAAEAVELFCHSARKWVGALAASLGGLDTLVFSGGIGENAAPVRERICRGLEFLGVRLNAAVNEGLISTEGGAVAVRVIPTDEELMLARATCRLLT